MILPLCFSSVAEYCAIFKNKPNIKLQQTRT
jgi:hypothetical protein